MKNKLKILILISCFFFNFVTIKAAEQFNFDVTLVEIEDNGNIFKGLSGGTATTDDGLIIIANEFEYNKALNILTGIGDVKINDTIISDEKLQRTDAMKKYFDPPRAKYHITENLSEIELL